MKPYIALLRGVNVVGKNRLPMKQLVSLLENLGCQNVATYIQSGNAVFRHARRAAERLADDIGQQIQQSHGFRPQVLLLRPAQLQQAVDANPFPEAEADPKSLHLYFLANRPVRPDLKRLASLAAASERFQLIGQVFYLHAPDGIGRSKLAAGAEKALGVPITARNWRTVCKVLDLANAT